MFEGELMIIAGHEIDGRMSTMDRGITTPPFREMLVDKVLEFSPGSVLEVGCGAGMNLHILYTRNTRIRLEGFDINPKYIEVGKKWLSEEIKLSVGDIETQLSNYEDGSFDVVFCHAVLIYISEKKITEVLNHLLRIARKGIVLLELHEQTDLFKQGVWIRNLIAPFRGCNLDARRSSSTVDHSRVPIDCGLGGLWLKYGELIWVTK